MRSWLSRYIALLHVLNLRVSTSSFAYQAASNTNHLPLHRLLTTTSHIQSARLLTSDVALSLSSCPSDYYILVTQQGVSTHDYSSSKKSTPLLLKALSPSQAGGSDIRSSLIVPDVLGPLDTSTWVDVLTSKCGVSITTINSQNSGIPTNELATSPRLIKLNLPRPISGEDNQRSVR